MGTRAVVIHHEDAQTAAAVGLAGERDLISQVQLRGAGRAAARGDDRGVRAPAGRGDLPAAVHARDRRVRGRPGDRGARDQHAVGVPHGRGELDHIVLAQGVRRRRHPDGGDALRDHDRGLVGDPADGGRDRGRSVGLRRDPARGIHGGHRVVRARPGDRSALDRVAVRVPHRGRVSHGVADRVQRGERGAHRNRRRGLLDDDGRRVAHVAGRSRDLRLADRRGLDPAGAVDRRDRCVGARPAHRDLAEHDAVRVGDGRRQPAPGADRGEAHRVGRERERRGFSGQVGSGRLAASACADEEPGQGQEHRRDRRQRGTRGTAKRKRTAARSGAAPTGVGSACGGRRRGIVVGHGRSSLADVLESGLAPVAVPYGRGRQAGQLSKAALSVSRNTSVPSACITYSSLGLNSRSLTNAIREPSGDQRANSS